jgi:hypothetical protein
MNAKKIIVASLMSLATMPLCAEQFETRKCVSNENAYVHCKVSDAHDRDIRIKQVLGGNCNADNTWGVDQSGIWVDHGCSALFEYTDPASDDDDDSGIIIAPEFVEPFYGPAFYYGAGYYESNNWNTHGYNHEHRYSQQHVRTSGGDHGQGGGDHGRGGGGREGGRR